MDVQRPVHYRTRQLYDAALIFKLYLHFGRMHININFGRVDFEKKRVEWIFVIACPGIVQAQYNMGKITMLERPPVYKQELLSPAFFCKFGVGGKPPDFYIAGFIVEL